MKKKYGRLTNIAQHNNRTFICLKNKYMYENIIQKYLFIIFLIIFLAGCRTLDLKMTSLQYFRQLQDTPINLTTSEEVNIELINIAEKRFHKLRFIELPIKNYEIKNDTLKILGSNIKSAIPFSKIESIFTRGVIDEEIGFVSEKELNKYIGSSNSFLATTSGVILGLFVGGASLAGRIKLIHTNDFFDLAGSIFIPYEIVFGILGGIIGNNIYTDSCINNALEKIKTERLRR
jgi:hypothetical protein